MNRTFIALLLSAYCSSSFSGYELITTGGDDAEEEYYLDLSSSKVSGTIVLVDALTSYSKVESSSSGKHLSEVKQTEFNCAKGLRRWHQVTFYSQQGALGMQLRSYQSSPNWYPLAKGSIGEILLKATCGSVAHR